jgi:hypothetical protein
MERSPRFRFSSDPTVDHSLHTRRAQLVGYERATAFLERQLPTHGRATS